MTQASFEIRAHGNRIGGEERASASDGRFEALAALDGRSLGSWPRSDAEDVQAALRALGEGRRELEA
ncbi:MAG: hypothetical protein AAF682_18045, partial [Planctomycetota bacterium]